MKRAGEHDPEGLQGDAGRGESQAASRFTYDGRSGGRYPQTRVLVAPDSFKGTFSAAEVAAAIADGVEAGA